MLFYTCVKQLLKKKKKKKPSCGQSKFNSHFLSLLWLNFLYLCLKFSSEQSDEVLGEACEEHSSCNMKILQLHLSLLLWCGAAESFTDKLVDLGQTVTLTCEIDVKNVYWFLMKPSQPPVYILRSFTSSSTMAIHSNSSFSKRFSLQINSSLVIHSITLDELGIYYCIFNETPPKISTGIRILHTNESSLDHHNKTDEHQQLRNLTNDHLDFTRHQQTLLIVSGLMNCVLLCGVIGLTVQHCRRPPKPQPQPPESNVQRQQDHSVQYEEIELPTSTSGVRRSQASSTYAMLQFPKPRQGA
ncbi:hypothetical protein MHYP_G00301540 [Metynnis hypsauchen]